MSKLLWTYVSSARVLLSQLYTFTWFWFNSSNVDFPWKCFFFFLVIIVDDGVVECWWRIITWHIWLLMVDVLNSYMLNVDVKCGDCMYIWRRLLVTTNTLYSIIGDDLCKYMRCCWVIYLCIHNWWWWILYLKWRRLWCFCCIKGNDLVGDWYHMHLGVMRRCIIWSCMSLDCMCAWWSVWLVNYLSVIFVNLLKLNYLCLTNWSIIKCLSFHVIIFNYDDVKLTLNGLWLTAYLFVWMGRRRAWIVVACLVSVRG